MCVIHVVASTLCEPSWPWLIFIFPLLKKDVNAVKTWSTVRPLPPALLMLIVPFRFSGFSAITFVSVTTASVWFCIASVFFCWETNASLLVSWRPFTNSSWNAFCTSENLSNIGWIPWASNSAPVLPKSPNVRPLSINYRLKEGEGNTHSIGARSEGLIYFYEYGLLKIWYIYTLD